MNKFSVFRMAISLYKKKKKKKKTSRRHKEQVKKEGKHISSMNSCLNISDGFLT